MSPTERQPADTRSDAELRERIQEAARRVPELQAQAQAEVDAAYRCLWNTAHSVRDAEHTANYLLRSARTAGERLAERNGSTARIERERAVEGTGLSAGASPPRALFWPPTRLDHPVMGRLSIEKLLSADPPREK